MSTKVEHALELQHGKKAQFPPFYTLYLQQRSRSRLPIQNLITNLIANLNISFVTSLNTS